MRKPNDIITFINTNGTIIYGEFITETADQLVVADPAQLYVQPTTDGRLNVQTIPLFFREFAKNSVPIQWAFNKVNLVISPNLELDDRLIQQYRSILAGQSATKPTAPPQSEPKIVKLFDE